MTGTSLGDESERPLDSTDLVAPDDVVPAATAMADAAVEWNRDRLDEYDPSSWEDEQKRHARRKAFGELSLIVQALDGLYDREDLLAPVVDHVVETVNDRRYFELLARKPRGIVQFGYPFAVAASRDRLGAEAEAVLERTLERRTPGAGERYPFAELHTYHLLRHLGYDAHDLDPDAVLSLGNVGTRPNFVRMERTQLYALTHDVFYYTNFGVPDERFPAATVPADLSTTLTGLTLRFLAAGDTDAVTELLLTGLIQRQLSPGFVRVVFSWLRRAAEGGTLPGSGVRDATASPDQRVEAPDPEALGDWNEDSRRWFRDYHTVVISAPCFATLRRDWDALCGEAPNRALDHDDQSNLDQLFRLGKLVELLSEYKLTDAAPLMESLAGTPVARAYDDVFDACASFLRDQRTPDGHVGYFPDERYLFEARGGTPEEFERKLLDPCTEQCEAALEAVERSRRE